ncbi:EAL domain-containing protein [Massilia terrae]|uniref:cyclic-guanylate-specific phosphodiesterase n=1 Tax=Massilia terrae TaxID=1811224 RepID=A0ABT2CYZ7_9BURK|nr:EAL domain-containing protein [Massilia terrae]MCS0659199.1 EAL domain-containing protein [Massilia terrae]
MAQEKQRALAFAREVLVRSEASTDEVEAAFASLANTTDPEPCSPYNTQLMRRLDVTSAMIQAIGILEHNTLVCSSLTDRNQPVELGKPQVVTPSGARIWSGAELPFARGVRFVVIGRGQYAAIVHRTAPITVSSADPQLVVAEVALPERVVITGHGDVKTSWLNGLNPGTETTFSDNEDVVAVAVSKRYALAAIAALPVSRVNGMAWSIARWLVPCALLMGVLLAWAAITLARAQLALPMVLKAALKRKELFMVYQPVVDLRTGKWVGAEALIRWNRPGGEAVRPDVFIVAAEDSGLIAQVTRQVVLQQVRRHAEILFSQFPHFHIAINLAAEDLQSEHTVALLQELVTATGARHGNLMVEATERSFADPTTVRGIVNALRKVGIRIAIDDFGTGYSSLSFLESVHFDLLKIDKSFVDTVQTGAATSQVIHHIIEMAKALRLEMIAEGVETKAQAQFLRDRGVQYAQGWLFAEPMMFEQMLEELKEQQQEAPEAAASGTR